MLLGPGASAAFATQVQVNQGAYSYGNGGEFILKGIGGSLGLVSSVPTSPDFATFCAQDNEYFYPGRIYDYTITSVVDHGLDIPLTNATAWLFHQWNSASLGDYDYTNGAGQRQNDAGQMQVALWALLGQVSAPTSGKAKTWYDNAMAVTNPSGTNNLGGVKVMNLYGNYPGYQDTPWAQDMLVETPEPASMGMLLLGCCTLPLPLLRRFRKVS